MNLISFFNKDNLIIIVITSYIFFWDISHTLGVKFDPRIITLLLFFILLKEILRDLKNKKFEFLFISSTVLFFLVIHSYFVGNLFNLKLLLSLIFLIYLFGIAYYFYNIILKNKKKILYLFVSLFLISIIFHYFFFEYTSNREPFSCGSIKNIFGGKNDFDSYIFILHFLSSYSLIFNENSHLAMSGVPVIVYSIYLLSQKSENRFKVTIIIVFIFICFLKSSATLIVGTAFSLLAVIIFEFKRTNKYFLIFSIILISINSFVFFQDKVCVNKLVFDQHNLVEFNEFNPFSELNDGNKKILDIKKKLDYLNINREEREFLIADLKEQEKFIMDKKQEIKKKRQPGTGSLSSDVFFHALKVTYNTILSDPLGRGFQGYELAFHDYNKTNFVQKEWLKNYNDKDASNTLFKIVTEFGVFSIFLYIMLLIIFLSNKIPIDNKIFLTSFIVTQTIRGAGYFNGAFLLILFLLFMAYFKKQEIYN
jgi:hypothetical protein